MAAKKGKILVVDDNAGIRQALKILLPLNFSEVEAIPSPATLVSTLERFKPDVVLLDMNFTAAVNTGGEGLYWVGEVRKLSPATEVVLFTAYADIELAVEGMKRGAFDFIVKPWDNAKLMSTLTAARDKAMKSGLSAGNSQDSAAERVGSSSNTASKDGTQSPEESMYWGNSPKMSAIRKLVGKVAPTDAAVLITGENGTGKDLLAREIHSLSDRSTKPLVAVDAGAIPEALFESELFGHVKGSFTDAVADHAGKFEQADGGTLFLDEIANIPLHLQAKLLRAIQSRSITRVGGVKPIPVDIRLICATNAELAELVQQGHFREDLFYRLNTITIALPPLRERREDIVPLSKLFLRRFAIQYHRSVRDIDREAEQLLEKARWNGNIRELRNCIEKAVILCEGGTLTAADIQTESVFPYGGSPAIGGEVKGLSSNEEELVREALRRSGGNISAAAKLLGISRPTLYAKLKKYGI